MEEVRSHWIDLYLVQVVLEITKCVRLEVAEENCVFVVFERIGKRSGKIESSKVTVVSSNCILKVAYVSSSAMPPNLLIFSLLFTVNCNLHSVVKHRIALVVIHNVELDTVTSASILNSKIKPLSVSLCVNIILHQAVVLQIRYFLS